MTVKWQMGSGNFQGNHLQIRGWEDREKGSAKTETRSSKKRIKTKGIKRKTVDGVHAKWIINVSLGILIFSATESDTIQSMPRVTLTNRTCILCALQCKKTIVEVTVNPTPDPCSTESVCAGSSQTAARQTDSDVWAETWWETNTPEISLTLLYQLFTRSASQ